MAKMLLRSALALTLIVLTLLPLMRVAWILATTGGINPSNDDLDFLPLIDQVLHGTYPWSHFFRDTFYASPNWPASVGHSDFFPALIQVFWSFFAKREAYVAPLYLGLALAALKVLLAFDAMTCGVRGSLKWLLLPLLFALAFSVTNLSVFEFGLASVEQGLNQLGLVLGIWAMRRFPGRWLAMFLMALGGILASWSWGNGPLVWPTFFVGMWLLGFRQRKFFIFWVLACLVCASPFFYFLVWEKSSTGYSTLGSVAAHLWNWKFWVRGIGWPWISTLDSSIGFGKGLIGLGFLTFAIALTCVRPTVEALRNLTPGFLLVLYALSSILLISVFRENLAPWYSSPFMLFWMGLAGIATLSLGQGSDWKGILGKVWGTGFFAAVFFLWVISNREYTGRSFYMQTRAPVSEACLRNYRHSPTYCEQTLFLYGPGYFDLVRTMGELLEKNGLSVFDSRQHWTLQGDFLSDRVTFQEQQGIPEPFWVRGLSIQRGRFLDYHPLNLFLHSPNAIDWTITLPMDLKSAEFHSAFAISPAAPLEEASDGANVKVEVREAGGAFSTLFEHFCPPELRQWQHFSVSLRQYAGKTVTLRLSSAVLGNNIHDWVMFRNPYLNVLREGSVVEPVAGALPENTDLSSGFPKPADTDAALSFERDWVKTDYCLGDFSHLYFRAALDEGISPRVVKVILETSDGSNPRKEIDVPLLADAREHAYIYGLKNLDLPRVTRITGISLSPRQGSSPPHGKAVKVTDLRLIRKVDGWTRCR